ncbi:cysteine-tryptophan domain-containing zinc finger protein 7 isoform X1 [Raphanus sativus]|uniref:Cysteine-tryptophan domain-containing zinc finger protein 7 isoform X1 n=1 Tax=Raphanus sativus TaxID=3726 RepID=A0A9W3D5S0_RAPSA|nr:cysteine-tryptophan domain-containing zinc finger protein 7 isoform X1 [Raphanus sativus]
MISMSNNSSTRREIGLGFGGGIEEEMMMEDSDFEEDSIHSYVSCVDPDLALSYIDDKLQNVLGHFQKDFEGGVSAENLGAKYGGYGSFLSMYQRSPLCKSPPPQVQHQVVSGSKCSASSAVPQVSVSGSTSKAPASDVLAKLKNFVKSSNIGTPDSKQKPVTKPSSSSAPLNHKTLKLRIKVGSSDNSSPKQCLNMPPSTSRVNCLSEFEERLLNGIHDSPTKILRAMVSFPLHKDQLLSPLSDDLIQLGKKGKIMADAGYVSLYKSDSKSKQDKLKEADKQSCEELVSKTLKLPLLSCLSPSYIHPAKEIDKLSDSYAEHVEDSSRGTNNKDLNAPLMGSKPELENNVVAFPERSVKGTESVNTRKDVYLTEGETPNSLVKVSKNETRNGDQILKSKLPEAHKSQKGSSRTSLRGKDTAVNIIDTTVVDKFQEDTGGSKDVCEGFFGNSGESKEQEQSSLVLKAKKESALKDSFDRVKNDVEACKHLRLVCEPDSKHPIKSSNLNEDQHNTKPSAKSEAKNHHSVEGGMENLGVVPERELSGTCKKQKTGKSRFSSVDQPGSNKLLDGVNKAMIAQASAHKVKDIAKASSHGGHEDRKRKQEEDKVSGDCLRLRETPVMESSGEKVRKKKRLKGSSCDGQELPFSNGSCDRDRGCSQENGRDSASHLPIRASSPSLICKDLGSEIIKTNVHEAKGSLVDSLAPSALNPRELKSGRNSEGDEHHDTDSTAGDTLKRCRDDCTAVEVKTKESRSKKRPTAKVSMESNKEGSREYQDPDTRLDTNSSHFSSPQNSDRLKTIRGKSNQLEVTAEKLKSKPAPPGGAGQVELMGRGTELSNTKEQMMRNDNHSVGSQNQKKNGSKHKDNVGSSPLKKESTSQTASNSIKEATDLKHMADRLKNVVSNHESTSVYFQAALKFLHGASILESSGTEHATHNSIARSNDIYGSTAKLCEFCAHEYEKNKDMGAAALAYKCMEVAYLRITYSSHGNINRYRSELQAVMQEIPSGESPSFASDGENPNQTLAAEKVALSNTVRSSPKVTGNHVLSSGNNSSLSQLLAFSQNVSFAMDASRKAQTAFAIANGKSSDTRYSSNGMTSIKRALDFDFQNMEKLLRVVRLAMESINM